MCDSVLSTPGTFEMLPAMTSAICVELADPDDGDQVDVTGDRVDLADAGQVGQGLGHLGDRVGGAVDEHDRGDHGTFLRSSASVAHARWSLGPEPGARRRLEPSAAAGHGQPSPARGSRRAAARPARDRRARPDHRAARRRRRTARARADHRLPAPAGHRGAIGSTRLPPAGGVQVGRQVVGRGAGVEEGAPVGHHLQLAGRLGRPPHRPDQVAEARPAGRGPAARAAARSRRSGARRRCPAAAGSRPAGRAGVPSRRPSRPAARRCPGRAARPGRPGTRRRCRPARRRPSIQSRRLATPAGGAERVARLDRQVRPVADVRDHLVGEVAGVHRDPVRAGQAEPGQPGQRPVQQRHVADRAERLGHPLGERAQPAALAGGEHHRADVRRPAAAHGRSARRRAIRPAGSCPASGPMP